MHGAHRSAEAHGEASMNEKGFLAPKTPLGMTIRNQFVKRDFAATAHELLATDA
jgi:hypothetical protein